MSDAGIRLAIHGGAGDPDPQRRHYPEHESALRETAQAGLKLLRAGGSAVDAVQRMVEMLEECPLFNAGVGAVLNRDGRPELDAAIMDGRGRRFGAVTGVSRTRHPVRLARAVMQHSPHLLFAGGGADALARELGLEEVAPDYFVTEERFRQLKAAHAEGRITLDHDQSFGTVGAVARDAEGHLAAATSTGGLTNKHPGRVGDTPILGAGTYADDRSAAVSCTGTGECFMRTLFGYYVHARILFSGWDLERACREGLDDVASQGGRGGCIAIDRLGRVVLPFNSEVMFRACVDADGEVRVAVLPADGGRSR